MARRARVDWRRRRFMRGDADEDKRSIVVANVAPWFERA